jgi:hypothetical protein
VQFTRIRDLGVFRGRPLKSLCLWGCTGTRNYAVLADIPTLENVILPEDYRALPPNEYAAIGSLRNHPALRQIAAEVVNGMGYEATGLKEAFWQDWDLEETVFRTLRKKGITFGLTRVPGGEYKLHITNQPLRDLSLLKGLPLVELDLHSCPFADLTPIREMKLHKLSISSDSVTDFTPLSGMAIERLYLRRCTHLRDLSFLTGIPLRHLYVDENPNLDDVGALAEMRTLEQATVPVYSRNIEALRGLPRLRLLGFQLNGGDPEMTVDEFWKTFEWVRKLHQAGVRPRHLRRLPSGQWDLDVSQSGLSDLTLLQGMPIEVLNLGQTRVTDLAPLRGTAVRSLNLHHTPVTDLSPLEGMPLTRLDLVRTPVRDLGPLAGMPLRGMDLSYTPVTDIAPLRGMPLQELKFIGCTGLTDVSPLRESPSLQILALPAGAKEIEFLRSFPKLERLSFAGDRASGYHPDRTPEEFWKEYDAKPK